jgi:stage II sporulation protein D
MRIWVATAVAVLVMPAVAQAGTVFVLDGGGWGHGVGMSQWGAEGYARHGYAYTTILAHYYPHTVLGRAGTRQVRVLLRERVRRVRIASPMPFLVIDARGRKVHLKAKPVLVTTRFTFRGKRLEPPLRFEAGAQPLTLAGAGYRGELVVEPRNGRLTVVNVLPLDRYLRGVVPWEVPVGWHEATYEAQAVAARSYALATLHPTADFDLFSDQRSQMYGGIRAERPETNLAVGATAGQVLTWGGAVIPAYYFSTSGGRTAAVHDAWPRQEQVPYLVSVSDPYDSISPRHRWATRLLGAGWIGRKLDLRGVSDAIVSYDESQHVTAVRFRYARGWTSIPAATLRLKLKLDSTRFQLGSMRLDPPSRRELASSRVAVHGFVRGLHGVQMQQLINGHWRTLSYLRTSHGRFTVAVRVQTSVGLRLVVEGVHGPMLTVRR